MPTKTTKFRKLVLTPGTYPLGKDDEGQPLSETFDQARLEALADSGNKFLGTGARIPVPFAHYDDGGNLVSPVNISEQGAIRDAFSGQPIGWRADLNGGFVTSFSYGEIEDPETGNVDVGLIADLDIMGDADDVDAPAGKIATTVREVSIGIHKDREDKAGNKYDELPIHVAACLNPVNTTQPNFVPVETMFSANVLLMNTSEPPSNEKSSDASPDTQEKPTNPAIPDPQVAVGPDALAGHVIEGLRQISGPIDLPEDTNQENFWERAIVAIRQQLASNASEEADKEESLTAQPKGQTPTGAPVAMSATNSSTPKVEKQATLLFSQYLASTRKSLSERIDALVKRQVVTSEWAETNLRPKVKEITLSNVSLDNLNEEGQLPPSEVESVVSALESVPGEDLTQSSSGKAGAPTGSAVDAPNDQDLGYNEFEGGNDKMSDEEALAFSRSIPVAGESGFKQPELAAAD